MATDSTFWSDIGPYLMLALGALVMAAWADLKRDNRKCSKDSDWSKKYIIKICQKVGVEIDDV